MSNQTPANRDHMQAYQISALNEPGQIQTCPAPTPGPGQVLLNIKACGLNFADMLIAKGQYQEKPALPFILGMEPAGHVAAHGPGTTAPAIGSRVVGFAPHGGLAQQGVVDAALCLPIPDNMPFTDAAAFQVAYGTSHVALAHRANLLAGETLLVLGAAGGVGLSAVQVGKLMGATVIACARGPEKLEICKSAGADHLIDSTNDDLITQVKALGGADVVYDPVGGAGFTAILRVCKPEARVIIVGFASGDIPEIPANILLVKNISVLGYYWGGYHNFRPQVLRDSLATLLGWYTAGRLKPHISHVLPLAETAAAYDLLRTRKSTGKLVIQLT